MTTAARETFGLIRAVAEITGKVRALFDKTSEDLAGKADSFGTDTSLTLADGILGISQARKDEVSAAIELAKKQLFIDEWNAAWTLNGVVYGKYDPENAPDVAHPFMGNDVWMTYEEAQPVMQLSHLSYILMGDNSLKWRFAYLSSRSAWFNCRTYLPFQFYSLNTRIGSAQGMFRGWQRSALEAVVFVQSTPTDWTGFAVDNCTQMFAGNKVLRTIKGLSLYLVSNTNNAVGIFDGCAALENLELSNLCCDISLKDSPLLSADSIAYIVRWAVNTNAITITLHPDAFGRLTDELVEAAQAKNIAFVTP